jgi:hypothetical protein
MSYITDLRTSITATVEAKANGRAAGAGLWASYVRSTMLDNAPTNVDAFDSRHTNVMAELEAIKPLSKEERNSLSSAKSIVKSAVERCIDVWQRTDSGDFVQGDDGHPLPRGKSDLQNDKSLFELLMKACEGMTKKLTADDADPLTQEQRDEFAAAMLACVEAASKVRIA